MDVIRELVAERMQQEIPPVVERDPIMEEPPSPQRFNRVQIITGMRRCGKTFYLSQLAELLPSRGRKRARDALRHRIKLQGLLGGDSDQLPRALPHA